MNKDEFLKALVALKNRNNPAHIVGVGVTKNMLFGEKLNDDNLVAGSKVNTSLDNIQSNEKI